MLKIIGFLDRHFLLCYIVKKQEVEMTLACKIITKQALGYFLPILLILKVAIT